MGLTVDQVITIQCSLLASDANKELYKTLASGQLDQCVYGTDYNQAIGLLACHMFTLAQRSQGAGGSVTSLKEGNLGINYSSGSGAEGDLDQTAYGKQLKRLQDNNVVGFSVLGAIGKIPC